jgi:hypothetical protein
MSIKVRIVLGPVDKHSTVLMHVRFVCPVSLIAYVTTWSNHNYYSKVVVRGRIRHPSTTTRSCDH